MIEAETDVATLGATQRHTAELDVTLGNFTLTTRLSITTSGLLAVAGLVGVVLAGAAGIVWAATGPARARATRGKTRK